MNVSAPFIRTVLGDVPVDGLGACSAHEHVIIDGPFIAENFPDFLLDDIDAACVDLGEFGEAGGRWVVDTMPTGPARNPAKLAEASRRTGIEIVVPTGMHLPVYYPDNDPRLKMDREDFTQLFEHEICIGLVDVPPGMKVRAGVIKVAGGQDQLSPHQCEAFAAAGAISSQTGCPIITHTEQGTAGEEQVQRLIDAGADPGRITLSHTDRRLDRSYHRALLSAGVTLEYDHHFRSHLKTGDCPTADLIAQLIDEFPHQIVVGMDLARRSYWHGHAGSPGLVWLLTELPELLRHRGVSDEAIDRVLRLNPRRAFAFAALSQDTAG